VNQAAMVPKEIDGFVHGRWMAVPLETRRMLAFILRGKGGRAVKSNKMIPCSKCGHAKSIHIRIYGRMYAATKLPQTCNFPGCRCKGYTRQKAA